ncbi:MAG: NADH-quinone oxidoreductase subunit I [Cyanobacteria bacterium SZAS LIN-2]|nr:NADH-quinone oxidoreductase subunit I [Cyanobacteria bacterium SZAS LIN-2]
MANVISRAFGGLGEIKKGLGTVFKHTFREPITKNYPDEVSKLSPHFRGRLALTVNPETGENLCISCRQCERVCPDKCIEITSHKSPETNKLELIDFKIDHGLCMFCGLCTEVCPTYCIINTNDFELADYSRESLIYDIKKLTLSQDESAFYFEGKGNPLPKPKPAKKPAEPAAAGAAAAAKPAEAKPAEAKAEAKPAEAKAEAKPAEAKAEAKPAEAKADAKPAEAKAEAKPAEAKPDEKKEEEKKD